ncbi:hypothetical protein Tco_1557195 [Tanacetum coccineum]
MHYEVAPQLLYSATYRSLGVLHFPKPRVCDAKYLSEQMLPATKDEAGVHLDEEENDFMLDNAHGDNTLEELSVAVIMMAHIQLIDDKFDAKPLMMLRISSHEKLKTVIHTSANDQINSDIIFDDPYVEYNGGQDEHDSNALDRPYTDIEFLINNVQIEAENQRKINIELQKQKSIATMGT